MIENIKNLKDDNTDTGYRIRKLTPKECWRLMGFSDEDFEKAKYKSEKIYLIGGDALCNARLMAVNEKLKQNDMETYASCIIKDSQDMGTTLTEISKLIKGQEKEKSLSVDIVITKLEELGRLKCATNITKCIDYMGMHFILMQGKDQHHMDIIVPVKMGKASIEKYMKITTESNLSQLKLFTILTLFAQIIELKIFGSTTVQANIQGNIAIIEVCENNILMQLSNLEMEHITERMSNSALYKQAGNSIVVDVLYYIFKNLYEAMPYLFDDLKVSSYFSGIGAFEKGLDKLYENVTNNFETSMLGRERY